MTDNENKKTATERLEQLESMQGNIIQALQPLQVVVNQVETLKETVSLLNKKLNAIVEVLNTNLNAGLTNELLDQIMIRNNVAELKGKVEKMVSDGLLQATESVGAESFIAVSESSASGQLVNPRMQFLLSSIPSEDIRKKLEGAKVGDIVIVNERGDSVTILESYNVLMPGASEQAPAAEAGAEASEAPAAEVASDSQQAAG